jgi:hypothetical protein
VTNNAVSDRGQCRAPLDHINCERSSIRLRDWSDRGAVNKGERCACGNHAADDEQEGGTLAIDL